MLGEVSGNKRCLARLSALEGRSGAWMGMIAARTEYDAVWMTQLGQKERGAPGSLPPAGYRAGGANVDYLERLAFMMSFRTGRIVGV